MSDIFSINVSAMNAAQIGLATTEHNIANANTAGYTRQQVQTNAVPGQLTGNGYVGEGTNVATITRAYDQFLSGQVNQQQAQSSQLNSNYSQIQQINNMLADSTVGVTPAINSFFSAANTVSSSPNSVPARQTMLSSAQSLATTFQSLNQQLTNINTSINGQISASVTSINSYATQIATLNQNVVSAQAASGGAPPNDLLDQRDQLVNQLNTVIGATVVKQGDGSYNVTVGNGQLLVVGNKSFGLSAVQSKSDPTQLVVASTTSGSLVPLQQNAIQGGSLGGLMNFRSQSLVPTQNQLGLIATGIAGTFNQQNQLGMDLAGNLANKANSFFNDPKTLVIGNTANTGTATVTSSISDFSKLTGSDYTLAFDGTNYTVTRQSDNTVTTYPPAAAPATNTTIDLTNSDGIQISVPSGAKAGDSFVVRPTANGAQNMAVTLTDPSKIAIAAPVMTTSTTSNSGSATISAGSLDKSGINIMSAATGTVYDFSVAGQNATFSVDGKAVTVNQPVTVAGNGSGAGTLAAAIQAGLTAAGLSAYSVTPAAGGGIQINHAGSLSPVTITNANAVASANGISNSAGTAGPQYSTAILTPAVTLTYSSATGTLSGFPATLPVTVTSNGVATSFAAGTSVTYTAGATISFGGISFSMTGNPANNDRFTVAQNSSATTDNRNGLLLAGLQHNKTMLGGTASYGDVYSQLVSQVGNQTRSLQVTSTAQTSLLSQTTQTQQSVSGVNLDEEAANLLRYQQAYQAAGKAMQIASTLFDTLLTLGR